MLLCFRNLAAPAKGTPTNNNAEIQAATKAILIASSIGNDLNILK